MTHLILLITLTLQSACSEKEKPSLMFENIDSMCDSDPQRAIEILDSVPQTVLTDAERHRRDLLSIKARDKAYLRHTSDSLVLDVIDYYSRHRDKRLYPEALYYGGRVYSDLEDYPAAFEYFQKALDENEKTKDLRLRERILSQTGALLYGLRLYSQAAPYLERSIEAAHLLADTFGLAYDMRTLCLLNIEKGDYERARIYNGEASVYAARTSPADAADMKADLASIYHAEGKIDSALELVRGLPDIVDPSCLNYTLAVASEIYLAAGITDTAYMYASELVGSEAADNHKTGYKVLLSPEIRGMLTPDTLALYAARCKDLSDEYLDAHDAQSMISQLSGHGHGIPALDQYNRRGGGAYTAIALAAALMLTVIPAVTLFYARKRKKSGMLPTGEHPDVKAGDKCHAQEESIRTGAPQDETLIVGMKEDTDGEQDPSISKSLRETYEHRYLRELVKEGKKIPDGQWRDLERAVEEDCPQFRAKMEGITGGRLTNNDMEIAILIRLGFKPSEIRVLVGRTKSAVSSRRAELAKKIGGSDAKLKDLDSIILGL